MNIYDKGGFDIFDPPNQNVQHVFLVQLCKD